MQTIHETTPSVQPDDKLTSVHTLSEAENAAENNGHESMPPPSEPNLGVPSQTKEERLIAEGINEITQDVRKQAETLAAEIKTDKDALIDEVAERLRPTAKKKATYADQLQALIEDAKYALQLFCDSAGEAYATIIIDTHHETHKIKSKSFRKLLRSIWYQKHKKGIATNPLDEVMDTLEAKAVNSQLVFEVHTRIAHKDGKTLVDCGNNSWECVQITAAGVSIIQDSSVKFVRAFGMTPLPIPKLGGDPITKVNKLRLLLNVTDGTWKRILAWILAAYSKGPYWTLILTGEQGSSKSLTTQIVRTVVDPSMFPLLTAPEEKRDVLFAAVNGHVLALDNLSGIPPWLSDLICGINTGTATRLRAYHTNDGSENAFVATKPVIVNGIDLALRDDLGSRAMPAQLQQIKEEKTVEEILKQFELILPEVLGGLFEIIAEILKNLPTTPTPKIRMADAGRWVAAAEQALKWKSGEFIQMYKESRNETVEISVESDLFASALIELLYEKPDWQGTAANLRDTLLTRNQYSSLRPPRSWPLTDKAIAGRLKRLAPALRHPSFGFQYEYVKTENRRIYKFNQIKEGAKRARSANVPEMPQVTPSELAHRETESGTLNVELLRADSQSASRKTLLRKHAGTSDASGTSASPFNENDFEPYNIEDSNNNELPF